MKSFKEYQSNKLNYFNSLHANINESIYTNENLLINRGKDIDSIFHKLSIYEWRQTHGGYIHESYKNVEFSIDEQFAARDMFITIAESYAQQLCDDFCKEYEISETLNWKESWNNTKNYFSNLSDKAKEAYNELKSKLKDVAEFIKDVTSKAIKSAKEMVDRFVNMMLKLKQGIGELLEKFGGELKEIQKEFEEAISEAITNKAKRPKENIYESLGIELTNAESINEGIKDWFKKKDKKEETNDVDSKKSNEYDDAEKAKPGSKKGGWKSVVLSILKQIAISVVILVIVPAIIGCAWGPAAGLIAATVAKFAMSGYAAIRLIKDIKDTFSNGNWKKLSKWMKAIRILMWILAIWCIAWGSSKAFEDAGTIIKAFQENTVSQLVPDSAVQGAMKLINNIWKSLTGENTKGYEDMMKVINGELVKFETITTEKTQAGGKVGQDVEEIAKQFNDGNFKSSVEAWDKCLKPNSIPMDKIPDGATLDLVLDGSKDAKHAKVLLDFLSKNGWEGSASDGFNVGLNNINKMAGSVFTLQDVPADIIQKAIDSGIQLGHNGLYSIIGATTQAVTTTVSNTISTVLPAIAGGFVPIIAMPKIASKHDGPFKLRMGSSRTGYDLYTIQEGDKGRKTMTFSEAEEQYGELNPTLFNNMKKSINKNFETLKKSKDELEKKDKLSKDDKKKLNAITKSLEKVKEGVNESECLIFFSDKVIETEEVKEGLFEAKEKEVKYKPVVIYVPFVMGFGDLANQRGTNKPARKKIIPFKGLFSSYEFLPVDGGMTEQQILEMIIDLAYAGVSAAYDTCIDSPCVKDGKKLIVNKDSKATGAREDFGGFNNEEITEILSTKGKAVTNYLGGAHKKGSSTVEKENTESQKERKAKAKEEWKENIENNEKIKKLIDDSKTLKKNLLDEDGKVKPEALDELTDSLLRVEKNYVKNKDEKKSFFGKIKDFFFGKKDDENKTENSIDKYDAEELQKLAYMLASLHVEKLKKRKNKIEKTNEELYEGEYDEIYEQLFILNSNMYLFEGEFANYLTNGDMIFESVEENDLLEFVEE